MTTKVLLVDDNKEILAGIYSVLNHVDEFKIVGEATDGQQAVYLASELKPNVVLMDITMPYVNGIDATRKIVFGNPRIKVIALSIHSEWAYVADMLEAGASGYLLKDNILEELQNAINVVTENGIYVSKKINDPSGKSTRERLSRKQKIKGETFESI